MAAVALPQAAAPAAFTDTAEHHASLVDSATAHIVPDGAPAATYAASTEAAPASPALRAADPATSALDSSSSSAAPKTTFWYTSLFRNLYRVVERTPAYQTASAKVNEFIEQRGLRPQIERASQFVADNRRAFTAFAIATASQLASYFLPGDGLLNTTTTIGGLTYAIYAYGNHDHQA